MVDRPSLSAALTAAALASASAIHGDYEKAGLLIALAQREPLTGEALKEYEAAARRLGEHSRNRALAALHRD